MQIPLVESRLALSYSSWFSDLGFAFFVRWLRVGALFNFGGGLHEIWSKKAEYQKVNQCSDNRKTKKNGQ